MEIELEEIELSVDDIYNVEKYKGDGLYFVSDGVSFFIVSVIGKGVSSALIKSKEILSQYIVREVKKEKSQELNYKRHIAKNLEDIDKNLDDILDVLNERSSGASSNISISDITKLVAVSQDAKNFKE